MTERRRMFRRALVVAVLVVAADQATKAAIASNLFVGERVEVLPIFSLVSVRNDGVAFNLLSGASELLVLVVTLVALGLLMLVFTRATLGRFGWLGVGLIAGGALGNLADRLRDGAVVDFIKFDLWPAFNLADTAITIGIAVLLLGALLEDRSEKADEESGSATTIGPDRGLSPRAEEVGGSIGDPG